MLTYRSPKPTLTLTETLAKYWLRGGVGGQNQRNLFIMIFASIALELENGYPTFSR